MDEPRDHHAEWYSQTEGEIFYDMPHIWKETIQVNLENRKRQRKNLWLLGEEIIRKFGRDMYTLLYLQWISNKDLLQGTGNSGQYCVAAWLQGEFGGKWIHVYVWLSPFAIHLKHSVQFSHSVVSDSLWLHGLQPTPGLPVHNQPLEFTQTHVHWLKDAIQPSQPLLSPSPSTFNLSQHQGLFKWVSSSH